MRSIAKYSGAASSIGILALLLVFCYANPYHNEISLDTGRQINILLVIGIPALINLLSFVLTLYRLSIVSFVWLTPFLLYIGLSKLPSLWNGFVALALLQAFILFALRRFETSHSSP